MLEKAIENWLTNTNEKNYQIAFCHALMRKGLKILYVSRHGQLEQGKDIIAVDNKGTFYAYQLKTGDINLKTWRDIQGEIVELIEIPISHPNYNGKKFHKPFLVLNGEISDPVRIQIVQINERNKKRDAGFSELKLIEKNELLDYFLAAQNEFLPIELDDYHSFFSMLTASGKDFLDKEKLSNYINNTIFKNNGENLSASLNKISSSIIITSHLLKSYQDNNNYYTLFEAWTLLYSHIVRYLLKNNRNIEQADISLDLIKREIENDLELLKAEAKGRNNFLEGSTIGDGGLVYKARSTLILGSISALELNYIASKKDYHFNNETYELITKYQNYLVFWGESAFPFFFCIIKFLEKGGYKEEANNLLFKLYLTVLKFNSINSPNGLPNAYYHVKDLIENFYLHNKEIDHTEFVGSSTIIDTIVEMLVRREQRAVLEQNWKECSYIQIKKFLPDNEQDYLLWRAKEGKNITQFFNPTQKWSELLIQSKNLDSIPQFFSKIIQIIPFYILVYPHRANKEIIRLLDIYLS